MENRFYRFGDHGDGQWLITFTAQGLTLRCGTGTESESEKKLEKWGAKTASSPKELSKTCHLVITMVGDTDDVRQVAEGENGLIHGARPGTYWIDMSTISPDATRDFAERAKKKGIDPRGRPRQRRGHRGEKRDVIDHGWRRKRRCKAGDAGFSSDGVFHHPLGPVGAGQTVKACNQILCGLNLLAMVEAFAFAKKSGVDLEKMLEVTTRGAAGSWALSNYGPRLIKGDLSPGFTVRFQQKDLRIVLEEAEKMALPLPGRPWFNNFSVRSKPMEEMRTEPNH